MRSQVFTYGVPDELRGTMRVGQVVEVQFGRQVIKACVIDAETPAQKTTTYEIKNIVRVLDEQISIQLHQLELAKQVSSFYFSPLSLVIKLVAPRWFAPLKRKEQKKSSKKTAAGNPKVQQIVAGDLVLSPLQQGVYQQISTACEAGRADVYLLHGVTGSGKTEIYTRVIKDVLAQGKQALFLLPEIALTTQFITHFQERFLREEVAILHSHLTPKERALEGRAIASGKARIVIGPRSAVFAPFQSLGCVIIDEEHDASYKQYDQSPRYHAREVAKMLGRIWQCPVVLGSATPSVESYFDAATGKSVLLELPDRFSRAQQEDGAAAKELPLVSIVDMREELKKGNRTVLSEALLEALGELRARGEQAILFLNRRGMSTVVMCRDCGHVMQCPRCEIPFVYHEMRGAAQGLFCHHCALQVPVPTRCPVCSSSYIKFLGAGTQRVQAEIERALPELRIVRMDADTTTTRGSHGRILESFRAHEADILLGTQMITKGFDLPNVNLVGIISVDNLLNMPDFRASELAFQLVTQVAGRAGRRNKRGACIVQTYTPKNPLLQKAALHDYAGFYEQEIRDREALFYPPFARLVKLIYSHEKPEKAASGARSLQAQIVRVVGTDFDGEIIGPSPAFLPKKAGKYYWHVIIKYNPATEQPRITELLNQIPDDWTVDIDPFTLL